MEFIEYTIGELALEVKTGKTPPTSNPEYFEGEIPWIGPSDLKGQKLAEDSERKISEVALVDKKAFLYQSGTVLISTIGDIGKTAIVKKPVASNQQLTGILVNEDIILPELFYYWIRLNKRILENKANTSVLSMLNNKLIKRIKVVFPRDFEDQYKIVGRLNRIQELIDKRIESIQLLDEYIRSVFLEMFGDPVTNVKNWRTTSLKNLGNIVTGNTPSKSKPEYYSNDLKDIDWIKSDNILSKRHYCTASLEKLSERGKEVARVVPENTTLIISITGSKSRLGDCAMTSSEATFNQQINAFVANKNPIYYYFLIKYSKHLIRNLSNNALKQLVTKTSLEKLKVIETDEHLQERFQKLFYKLSVIKNHSVEAKNQLSVLSQSFLQDSFSPESRINEEEVFESLLQTFTKEDLKQGERLKHLLNWINCKEPRFSQFESYNLAWDRLRELLEDGSIEQVLDKNEIKLKVVE